MIYHLKAIKDGVEHMHPPCPHYTVTRITPECSAVRDRCATPGIIIDLGRSGKQILLPQDADHVYVMNGNGDTIDSIHALDKPARRETA